DVRGAAKRQHTPPRTKSTVADFFLSHAVMAVKATSTPWRARASCAMPSLECRARHFPARWSIAGFAATLEDLGRRRMQSPRWKLHLAPSLQACEAWWRPRRLFSARDGLRPGTSRFFSAGFS
ncbi:unnamed protein product, partial [Symbiodinium sp. KB8]